MIEPEELKNREIEPRLKEFSAALSNSSSVLRLFSIDNFHINRLVLTRGRDLRGISVNIQ